MSCLSAFTVDDRLQFIESNYHNLIIILHACTRGWPSDPLTISDQGFLSHVCNVNFVNNSFAYSEDTQWQNQLEQQKTKSAICIPL